MNGEILQSSPQRGGGQALPFGSLICTPPPTPPVLLRTPRPSDDGRDDGAITIRSRGGAAAFIFHKTEEEDFHADVPTLFTQLLRTRWRTSGSSAGLRCLLFGMFLKLPASRGRDRGVLLHHRRFLWRPLGPLKLGPLRVPRVSGRSQNLSGKTCCQIDPCENIPGVSSCIRLSYSDFLVWIPSPWRQSLLIALNKVGAVRPGLLCERVCLIADLQTPNLGSEGERRRPEGGNSFHPAVSAISSRSPLPRARHRRGATRKLKAGPCPPAPPRLPPHRGVMTHRPAPLMEKELAPGGRTFPGENGVRFTLISHPLHQNSSSCWAKPRVSTGRRGRRHYDAVRPEFPVINVDMDRNETFREFHC